MKEFIKTTLRAAIHRFGIDVIRYYKNSSVCSNCPPDFSKQNIRIYDAVKPYTMTSPERVNALIESVRYVVTNRISGAIVECGVWKGGSIMAIGLTLKELASENRKLFLYDTFSVVRTNPGEFDVSFNGEKADASNPWACPPLDEVKENIFSTGYPKENIHFIEGKVEETIPKNIPTEIALLRLDTDLYESTKHELVHLFPLLSKNGVLIIDDYGHYKGAGKAVDEYIANNNIRILLNRIDYTGRIAIKT